MEAAGLSLREEWITRLGYTGADGRSAIDELESRGPLPTGLVVANLNAALGVLAAIHARELRVPSDVSIVALHDVWYADATWPPITTVRMPLRELGTAAVARVVDGGQLVTHATIRSPAPELIVRQSTAAPR
jgi:LacI family transcriptional regulator